MHIYKHIFYIYSIAIAIKRSIIGFTTLSCFSIGLWNCEFHVYTIYTPHMLIMGLYLASPPSKAQYPHDLPLTFSESSLLKVLPVYMVIYWCNPRGLLLSDVECVHATCYQAKGPGWTGQNYSACLSAEAWVLVNVPSHFMGYILSTHLGSSEFIILVTSNDLESIALVRKAPQDSMWSSTHSGFRLMFRPELLVVG